MTYNLKLLVFFGLFFSCLCEQRLLIDQLRWDFLELEDKLWNFSANGLLYKPQEAAEIYLAKHFQDFDQKLNQIPQALLYGMEPLRTIPEFLFLFSDMKIIENIYEKFRDYQRQQLSNSKHKITIEDVIYDILHNKTGAKATMDRIYSITFIESDNITWRATKMITDNYRCKNIQQSPQQIFYNIYNLISLNGLKAYILQQFAYLGNRLWDKENNVELSIFSRKSYEEIVKSIIFFTESSIKASPDIRRCDPSLFIKGVNYEEFTRLLQGHIQNEVDMSYKRTCRSTCSGYSYTKSYGCYDYKSEFCRKVEKCNGNIIGCFFVESHASICISSSPSRRYDFIRYKSDKVYGKNGYCSNEKSVNSWQRWFVRCHYCMCLCDETGPLSDRYISLKPVLADVENNRIVTGIRLVKRNRILHLQIQEGKLLPYGYVNQSTVHWVNVPDYTITGSSNGSELIEGKDFFRMTYGDRSMAIDEIKVYDEYHVITGVRFQHIINKIHLQIHVSPFNWQTGTVDHGQGYYIFESSITQRKKINLENSDIPTKTDRQSNIHLTDANTYVEFTHSDFNKDAAQTTIPFIDTQEVINKPAVPLVGAGIFYKGNPGFGGFIAPQIQTYNYGPHLSRNLPVMANRQDIDEEKPIEAK